MRAINKTASATLDLLESAAVANGGHIKINNAPGFMAVCVEKIGPGFLSVTHYFEQNGDLVPDPDMEFWKGPDGRWRPVCITQMLGSTTALRFDQEGQVARYNPHALADLCAFTAHWMKNISKQQKLRAWWKGQQKALELRERAQVDANQG